MPWKNICTWILNRIDDVIVFNSLEKHDIDLIIEIELKNYKSGWIRISVKSSDKAKAYIADKGFDKQFGARPLKELFKNMLKML
jgi:ATP-dependent Clp protease ATP-binding subunit ClpC